MNWLKGLIAAVVGGVANTITVMVVDPAAFNLDDLPKLGKVAIVSAILSAAFYLKQSPIPNAPKTKVSKSVLPLLVLFCALSSAMLLSSGCATNSSQTPQQQTEQRAQRLATLAELAAYDGTVLTLQSKPEYRAAFNSARVALAAFNQSTNVNAESFAQIFAALPVKELGGKNGSLIVGNVMVLYDSFARENIRLNNDSALWLRPIALAVERGLARGLVE